MATGLPSPAMLLCPTHPHVHGPRRPPARPIAVDVIEVLEDQEIPAEHAMLLVKEFAADVEVGLREAEFLVACIKEPTIINNIFHLEPQAPDLHSIDSSYVADEDDSDAFHAAVAVSRPRQAAQT